MPSFHPTSSHPPPKPPQSTTEAMHPTPTMQFSMWWDASEHRARSYKDKHNKANPDQVQGVVRIVLRHARRSMHKETGIGVRVPFLLASGIGPDGGR
eukprot:scaffold365_cov361-Pavlova_lutheri.AAC.6